MKKQQSFFVDNAISALNAWIGDYLVESDNELQINMSFFRDNQAITPQEYEFSDAKKLCIFVHGLGCNESLWDFPEDLFVQNGRNYGDFLENDTSYRALYLRYNTGKRISQNSEEFALLLEKLCEHFPEIEEIVLIGHSMGGLVIRSATYFGEKNGLNWIPLLRHAIYIGSPHLGAPLEKFANITTNILGAFNTTATQVISDVIKTRSAGIKDLRFGNLVETEWLEFDPDELMKNRRIQIPWLSTAQHHFIIGHKTKSKTLGDTMVSSISATAGLKSDNIHIISGIDHLALMRHPKVYKYIQKALKNKTEI